ncbi:hypothetical protein TrRE_jg6451 [Triparma retinervis]|uniref:Uncharacterized protein n=1 Tax=Triparma retinervis TaxID=2557542 RepID=A0A9W7G417_9STRA|nr:hypothetical protein TrRE_jg6451 [Triparma retinervis]
MQESRGYGGLSIEVTTLKSGGSSDENSFPSPKNLPKSPVTPVNSPQKILARMFLVFFTLMYTFEVLFWFTNNEFNFPSHYDFYSKSIPNIQIPQVLAPMSAQAVFTHWMIHIEKIYVNSNPRDPTPIPPEPVVAWHPFSNLRNDQWSTILLKAHFVLHNFVLILTLIGCAVYGKMGNSFEPIMQITIVPILYRFFTIMMATIRLRHDTLALEKMAEYSFSFGLGTIFICIFLASETLGCFIYDTDAVLRDDPSRLADLSDFDYGPRKCSSTLYGNYMLSYNALFANIAYVLLYWLVDSDFRIISLMRLMLPRQYTAAFVMQTVASVVFIFFFSQKEFPTKRIDEWWPYAKTMYMGMWGYSFIVLCYKNIPSHHIIGFDSGFFSERHMLIISDPKDKESFKSLKGVTENMVNVRISEETDARHKEEMEVVEYEEEDTDMILGGGGELHVEKRRSKPGEFKVVQKEEGGLRGGGETREELDLSKRSNEALARESEGATSRPSSPVVDLMKKHFPKSSWLNRSVRIGSVTKAALAKGVTSKKMFVLRFFLCLFSYALFGLTLSMVNQFDFYKLYYFEIIGALSFCSVCVHYSIMVKHPSIYDKNAYLEMKPLWVPVYENGRKVSSKFRCDRLVQVLVSPKLQYYMHNVCVFGWRVIGALMGVGNYGMFDVVIGVVSFIMALFIYYYIIRRMCAALRQRMEPGYSTDDGVELKEQLFLDGMSSLAVTIFFVFEVFGCVLQVQEDPLLTTEDDLRKTCGLYKMANTDMAINIVFLQIMNHLTFSEMSGVELFTFKMRRYHLVAFFMTLLPCYASAFLFSRREQVDSLDMDDIDFFKQPLLKIATVLGGTYFSFIWVVILFILGRRAKRVREYDFVASDIEAIKNKFAPEEEPDVGPRHSGHERASIVSWGKLKGNMETVAAAIRESESSADKMNTAAVLKRGRAVSAITKFNQNQKIYEGRKATHRRLWILKVVLFFGTVLFVMAQIFYLVSNSSSDTETSKKSKGLAYIAQPLSFACCMMHYFCDIDIENEGVSITRRLKLQEVRAELDKKHKTLLEIEKTLERFFGECFAALLVIIYVSLEASGCVEGAEDLDLECTSYFSSARIFATTMAVPLVMYVATFVADLSMYDLMTNNVNKVLGVGLFMTFLTGGVSVFAFAIRTWSFDPDDLPFFYTLNFIDFWEVIMFGAVNLVLRGVVDDCKNMSLDDTEKMEILQQLAEDIMSVEREVEEFESVMQKAVDEGDIEKVDKFALAYTGLKRTQKEMHYREAELRRKGTLTKQESVEAVHRNKAKVMRRHSVIAEKNILLNESDTESQLRHCRIIRQLNEADIDADIRERELIRTRFGSHDGMSGGEGEGGGDGEGVHYRASRGSRVSSNWLGLIV